MTDFRALFAAAEKSLDIDALQSLAEGWAEVAETAPPISCTDVYTGLATKAHFVRRMHELSSFGTEGSRPHALAIISLPEPLETRAHDWTLLAQLGETVQSQLSGTGSIAMYRNSAIHVLFPLSESNVGRLMECRTALETVADGILRPARMRFYPVSAAPSEMRRPDSFPEAM